MLLSSHRMFPLGHDCTSAFSATSPCCFCSQADVAISVLREESINTVLARYHFSSRLWSWFMRGTRGCVPMSWNTFIHKILRKFFWPFWQITQRVTPYPLVVFIFIWVSVFFWFTRRVSSYSLNATRTLTSCWCGMQCRNYCFLRYWCRRCGCCWAWGACRQTRDNESVPCSPSAIFDELWFLTTGPLVGISVIFAEFSEWENGRCIFEKLYCHE